MNFINFYKFLVNFRKIIYFLVLSILLVNCSKITSPNAREVPTNALERARQNVEQGKGIGLKNILKRDTNFEFSSSNPMWRATLEVIDFIPLSVVDYSGGIIISDWYNNGDNDALKISIRFLSNEIRSDSLKITVHQRKCKSTINCSTNLINSKLSNELASTILKKAATIEKIQNSKVK